MDRNDKTENDGKSKETAYGVPFRDCQAMFEKMGTCCGDGGNVIGCCHMMARVMEDKSGKSKGEHKREK